MGATKISTFTMYINVVKSGYMTETRNIGTTILNGLSTVGTLEINISELETMLNIWNLCNSYLLYIRKLTRN